MTMAAIKIGASSFMLSIVVLTAGCSSPPYKALFEAESPDGRYVARIEYSEEGMFGSTRYRVNFLEKGKSDGRVVFTGDNADVENMKWISASELLVPFCFGSINSVESVLPEQVEAAVHFRTRSSSSIRIHILTVPNTQINGSIYCKDEVVSN